MTSNITERALEDKTYIELKAEASKKAGYEMSYKEVSKQESIESQAKAVAEYEEQEAAKEKGMGGMQAILWKHDIRMAVGGCGCCDSPWVDFEYKGKRILDGEDDAGFDMFEDDDGIILLND